ncbi:hypothetical protein, partial [Burkholderia orbicola]|uniref:hypothetical protein n=1 Tax=Burkholderia orbicola TaxID=2978683 RepID=UPI002FDF190C
WTDPNTGVKVTRTGEPQPLLGVGLKAPIDGDSHVYEKPDGTLVTKQGAVLTPGTKLVLTGVINKADGPKTRDGSVEANPGGVGNHIELNEKQALEDLGLSQTTLSKDYVTSKGQPVRRDLFGTLSRADGQPLAPDEQFVAKSRHIEVDEHGQPREVPGMVNRTPVKVDENQLRKEVEAWNRDPENKTKRSYQDELARAQQQAKGVFRHLETDPKSQKQIEQLVDANLHPITDLTVGNKPVKLEPDPKDPGKPPTWTDPNTGVKVTRTGEPQPLLGVGLKVGVVQEGSDGLKVGAAPDLSSLYQEGAARANSTVGTDGEFVNSEHMVVDRDGKLKRVLYVRAITGEPVYLKDDGTFTTDIHGGPLPENIMLVNDQGVEVDKQNRPKNRSVPLH